jgi:hypothetical protein
LYVGKDYAPLDFLEFAEVTSVENAVSNYLKKEHPKTKDNKIFVYLCSVIYEAIDNLDEI